MVDIRAYPPNCQFMDKSKLMHVRDATDLGVAIRRWRRDKAWRQSDLGESLGVHRVTIAKLERGEPVSSVTAIKALTMLGAMALVIDDDRLVAVDARDATYE